MKRFYIFISLVLTLITFSCFMQSCVSSEISGLTGIPQDLVHYTTPGPPALYETTVRITPTIQNYSFIAFIIKVLKWLSDATNRTKT